MSPRPRASIRPNLSCLFLAACFGCAGGAANAPPPETAATPPTAAPPAGCDLTSRDFQQTSPGPCGTSTWHFTAKGDGSYDAKETGCANATGTARYDGTTVTLDFTYGGGAGQYTWPLDAQCQGAAGKVTWSAGALAGKDAQSTLSPMK